MSWVRCGKERSHLFVGNRVDDGLLAPSRAYDQGNAGSAQNARGLDLGHHAARAHRRTRTSRNRQYVLVHAFDRSNEMRALVERRVGAVKSLDIREDDGFVGVYQAGDQSAQRVVVTEANLFHRHGVVLVDDGHNAQLEQAVQRIARMQVSRAVRRVASGEQHERRHQVVTRERFAIGRHEQALPHRRRRLKRGHIAGTVARHAQALQAAGDGTRRHDDHLPALGTYVRHLVGKRIQILMIDAPLASCEGGRTDFHHQTFHQSSVVKRSLQPGASPLSR